jgi:hypothetical protein
LREESRLKVYENRVLRRIFGPRRETVKGKWRKPHNEVLNDVYCSSIIVWVTKLRRMIWAGNVARMGERRVTGFWSGNLRERDHLGDPGIDERIILRRIFRK